MKERKKIPYFDFSKLCKKDFSEVWGGWFFIWMTQARHRGGGFLLRWYALRDNSFSISVISLTFTRMWLRLPDVCTHTKHFTNMMLSYFWEPCSLLTFKTHRKWKTGCSSWNWCWGQTVWRCSFSLAVGFTLSATVSASAAFSKLTNFLKPSYWELKYCSCTGRGSADRWPPAVFCLQGWTMAILPPFTLHSGVKCRLPRRGKQMHCTSVMKMTSECI